jgi:hypothetical protein
MTMPKIRAEIPIAVITPRNGAYLITYANQVPDVDVMPVDCARALHAAKKVVREHARAIGTRKLRWDPPTGLMPAPLEVATHKEVEELVLYATYTADAPRPNAETGMPPTEAVGSEADSADDADA